MAYPSNVGCGLVVPTNKDTPLYLSTPYTRYELNSLQTTYWRNILSLDKDLVKLLVKRLANLPESPNINEIIVEARRILLDLKEKDIKPSDLNTWPPEI